MNKAALRSRTRRQLLALAGEAKLRGRHRMSKEQLVEALDTRASAPISDRRPKRRADRDGTSAAANSTPMESREATPKQREPKPESRPSTDLPSSYGRTRLTLMEIDPYRVYAYWEVTPHDRQAATARLGLEGAAAHWVLRFYDVTYIDFDGTNAHGYFDHDVDLVAGNWYVNLWSSEKTYCADIGALAPSGHFAPACRSNFVHTPRAEPAPDYRPRWLQVGRDGDLQQAPPAVTAMPASPDPLPSPGPAPPPITEADVREYYGGLTGASETRTVVSETESSEPPSSTAAIELSVAPAAPVLGESTPPNAACGDLHAEIGYQSAPFEARLPDTVSSFGSAGFAAAPRTEIDLKLNAEVVLSGRAQPGQMIQVNGQWLEVDADGTFSLRLALPIKK